MAKTMKLASWQDAPEVMAAREKLAELKASLKTAAEAVANLQQAMDDSVLAAAKRMIGRNDEATEAQSLCEDAQRRADVLTAAVQLQKENLREVEGQAKLAIAQHVLPEYQRVMGEAASAADDLLARIDRAQEIRQAAGLDPLYLVGGMTPGSQHVLTPLVGFAGLLHQAADRKGG